MTNPNERLQYLFDRYISGEYTPEEWTEFWDSVKNLEENDPAFNQMKEWWNKYEGDYDLSSNVNPQTILDRVLMKSDNPAPVQIPRRTYFNAGIKYAAAILILISTAAFFFFFNKRAEKEAALVQTTHPAPTNIIEPGKNKAVLTLSNGKQVVLDDVHQSVISDGGIDIEKRDGQLIYGKTDIVAFNTMTTPKGGQFQVVLPDGTKIWLNAASSITYPTVFSKNERRVSITGEVYFDVAKNPKLPFKVTLSDQTEIQVLGTQFNVNAYADEPLSKTTLIEGSVKINNSMLRPGEAYTNGKVIKGNTEEAVAWKNGLFIFNKTDLQSVMRQLSRWYNVEVKYEGEIRVRTFSGKIGRDLTLSDLLDGLKRSDVHFRIEGNTIIVTS